MAKYIDFLYHDEETGEQFFVELKQDNRSISDLRQQADDIAHDNFDEPVYEGIVDAEEAEIWGLDTY